jgi:hypothetical protein
MIQLAMIHLTPKLHLTPKRLSNFLASVLRFRFRPLKLRLKMLFFLLQNPEYRSIMSSRGILTIKRAEPDSSGQNPWIRNFPPEGRPPIFFTQ